MDNISYRTLSLIIRKLDGLSENRITVLMFLKNGGKIYPEIEAAMAPVIKKNQLFGILGYLRDNGYIIRGRRNKGVTELTEKGQAAVEALDAIAKVKNINLITTTEVSAH